MNIRRAFGALLGCALTATACGSDGSVDAMGETIEVSMTEMAFDPEVITTRPGQELSLRFINDGAVRHEAIIGTAADQQAHGEAMAEGPHGPGGTDDHHGERGGGHDDDDGHTPNGDGRHGDGQHGDGQHGDGQHGDALAAVTLEPGNSATVRFVVPAGEDLIIGCHEPGHWEAGMAATIRVER
ncbi:MAG: hypothetical protein JJU45_01780 [Acidimicrobiia bacterium]|nr:hypothetical protein [Acidimicrobiia bacterium]